MYGSTFVRNQASDYTERKKAEICRFQALPIDPRTKQVFRWYRPRFLNLYALPAFLVFFSALVQKFYEGTVQYHTKVHVPSRVLLLYFRTCMYVYNNRAYTTRYPRGDQASTQQFFFRTEWSSYFLSRYARFPASRTSSFRK